MDPSRKIDKPSAPIILTGLALVGILAIWIIYNQYINRSSRLNLNHNLPVSLFAFFLLLVVARSLWPRILPRNSLILITSMMLAASYIPGDGLMSYLLGSWAMPIYFATPENQWDQFHPYLQNWVVPTHREGIRWFHEGLPDGRRIPWDIWIRPLFGWASLGLAFLAVSLGLSSIFRKQWMENEKLTYPMMIPIQILAGDRKEIIRASSGKVPLFWVGFAISFGILSWNVLTFFNEYLPDIDLRHGWVKLVKNGINVYTSQINLLTLGLSYFTSVEILTSAIVFFLIKHIEIMIAARVGYVVPVGGGATHPGASSPLISWQTAGAFMVYVAWSVWNARHRISDAFLDAKHNRPRERLDLLSCRAAIILVMLGVTFSVCWLVAAGFQPSVACAVVFAVLVTYVGISKMVAELGLPYLSSPLGAEAFAVAAIGTSSMSHASILLLSITKNLEGYSSGMVMSHLTMVQKIRGNLDPRRLLIGILAALLLAYLLSMIYAIWLGYGHGAYNFSSYTYTYYARQSYQRVVFRLANPWMFDVHRMTLFAVGATVMGLLIGMRYKLPWFRLNPVGLAIPLIPHQFSTFVLALLIKTILLRIGGMHAFQRGIPLFIGLVAGYVSGVAFSSIIDLLFFPGAGHGVHWW